ncbi:MAG: hypothetical protein WB949_09855 [Candidatus Acidiferrales bacterium]
MEMTSKDRFDALVKLAELMANIREKRREIEWRVSVALWAMMAGAIVYLRSHSLWWSLILLILVVLTHGWLWIRTNYNSSQRDIELVH